MRLLAVITFLACSGCSYNEELMAKADGSMYRTRSLWMGGDHLAQTSSGSKYASTNTASFRDAALAATAIAGAAYSASTAAAREVTSQVATKEASKQAINASNNATAVELGAQGVQEAAIAAEAAVIPK